MQRRTGDESTDSLTQFKEDINETNKIVLAASKWKFLEKTRDITTAASTARYELPNDCGKLISVTTTPDSGTTLYRPDPVDDPQYWEYLQSLNRGASNITEFYYREGNDLLIWPSYSTASKTITFRYRKKQPADLSLADYTTGTITSITSAARALVGASTVWTGRKPVGEQWIRIDYTTGDFAWYRVSSIDSDTTITLEKDYQGATIAAATETYTIGEFSVVEPDFHDVLLYRPMALYYDSIENPTMSARYWRLYDGGKEAGLSPNLGGLLQKMRDNDFGTTEAGYYPPQGHHMPTSPEERSRDSITGESWI